MRLKLGRPDIAAYHDRFTVPAAGDSLSVTFLGVATLLVDDGETPFLTDGFFSRPGLLDVGLRKIAPDRDRIAECLRRADITSLEAVIPVHTHFDHAMDSAVVAQLTGAQLTGGASAAHIGHAVPANQVHVVTPDSPFTVGNFEITMIESEHCPPDRYPGVIDAPVVPPVKTKAYKCGEAWSIIARHASGPSLLIQGSAGYVPGALAGQSCDVAYLGVGQLGIQSDDYIVEYWRETVTAVGAKRVVLIHWDDFFRPLDQPLRALPYAGDDLDNTMRLFTGLAAADGVHLCFPTVWRREDPWS